GLHGAFAFPIRSGTEVLGVIEFFSGQVREPDANVVEMLAATGGQIGQFAEREQAREAVRTSEERYRALFQTNPLPSWVFDRETLRILAVNDEAMRRYGYTQPEFLGLTIADLRPPEDVPALFEYLDDFRAATPVFHRAGTWRHRKKDGAIMVVEISGQPVTWEGSTAELVVANDITERMQTDEALSQRARLAELNAEVGIALAQGESLRAILQRSAEALVRHLDAAFARIWTLNERTNTLELQASAGMYTHLDGAHSRVPVGQFKIGLIAQERRPHLTNAVVGDPRVHDQEWAKREGMVAFAGYPLIVQERVVGVMAMFAHHPFSNFVQQALGSIADGIAVGIARQNAEEARRVGHELLHSVIEGANDPIFVKDAARRYLLLNSAEARALGRPPEEIVGRDADSLYPAEIAAVIRDGDERVIRDNAPVTQEVTVPGTDGPHTYLVTKVPTRDDAGQATGLIGVAKDITERKHSEERIHESEQRFREIAEHVREVFFISDPATGAALYISPAYEAVFGQSLKYAYATPNAWTELLHPDDRARMLSSFRRSAEQGAPDAQVFRIVLPDRSMRWIRGQTTPVRDATGRVARIVGIAEDITELRRAEEQLRQSQKMEAVGRLAGGVAHDFNNLLTVISSYTELLLEDLPAEDASRRDDLGQIKKAAADAAALTRQLLAFSRQQVLEARVLDLNEIVSGAGKMLERLIGEDVTLALVLARDLGAVKADPGQIEQVIMNLAVNARDAMPMGGRLTIETANVELDVRYTGEHSVVNPGRYVELVVSDTGVGMDDETKRHIFEPFFTTKELGKGTGLGLATVYGIVKQSGGFVWVYSEPGAGTTFKIHLPRVEEGEAMQRRPARPPPARGSEIVLLAEDAAPVRAVARQILERNGYTVLEAPNGKAAIDIAAQRQGPIHLLLTDVVMPELSGRQLADQITAQRPELKVLFMSGYTDDAVVRHGVLEAGIAYLQKPFTPDGLARKVREVLDSSPLR
ncbi:MAG TPA: PAS domain S-box protein, partial [Gemmatimonadales bacterium]